uniref:Pentraxin (PTX) domain-containing protein n=1 Tax=Hucho hucho TaxID=62062 RepID=A0A4W5QUS7_9TELE
YMTDCWMMLMMLLLLILSVVLFTVGLGRKVLVFPYETDFSFVALIPQKEMGLRAFTLFMRLATELEGERQIILFAYGRVAFYLSGDGAFFLLPPITTFRTSLCLTWESRIGLAAFWVDGRRSTYQVYKIQIQALHYGHKITKGNIFDWATIEYQLNGNVMVVDDD